MDDFSPEEYKIKAYNSDHSLYSMIIDSIVGNPNMHPEILEELRLTRFTVEIFSQSIKYFVNIVNSMDWTLISHDQELDEMKIIADELDTNEDDISKRLVRTINWSIDNHRVNRAHRHCK